MFETISDFGVLKLNVGFLGARVQRNPVRARWPIAVSGQLGRFASPLHSQANEGPIPSC